MFVTDTNILVYAVDTGSPFHRPCRDLVDEWKTQAHAWYATWGIVYEFLRVTTHRRAMRRPWTAPEAWRSVEALLGSPGFRLLNETDQHARIAAAVLAETPSVAGNAVHDAHIAILMREHGIRTIYTRDTGFHRFPFLEVIDPITMLGDRRGPRRAASRVSGRRAKALKTART